MDTLEIGMDALFNRNGFFDVIHSWIKKSVFLVLWYVMLYKMLKIAIDYKCIVFELSNVFLGQSSSESWAMAFLQYVSNPWWMNLVSMPNGKHNNNKYYVSQNVGHDRLIFPALKISSCWSLRHYQCRIFRLTNRKKRKVSPSVLNINKMQCISCFSCDR